MRFSTKSKHAWQPRCAAPNFGVKLTAGRLPRPAAEPPCSAQDARRHAACRRVNDKCGERRAARPHARGATLQLTPRDVRRSYDGAICTRC
jgi:hypothetical protein